MAGWLLLPPLLAHSLVLRVIPLYLDGGSADVGLQYISHGFDYHGRIGWWLNAVYYVGFVTVASTHVVNGEDYGTPSNCIVTDLSFYGRFRKILSNTKPPASEYCCGNSDSYMAKWVIWGNHSRWFRPWIPWSEIRRVLWLSLCGIGTTSNWL